MRCEIAPGLELGHDRELVDKEMALMIAGVDLRIIAAHKFHAALDQPRDEMHVAREPVELGNDQRGFAAAAFR